MFAGCSNYWRGCFSCPNYLGPEHRYFCRRANRELFGVDIVQDEKKPDVEKQKEQGAWWNGRKSR